MLHIIIRARKFSRTKEIQNYFEGKLYRSDQDQAKRWAADLVKDDDPPEYEFQLPDFNPLVEGSWLGRTKQMLWRQIYQQKVQTYPKRWTKAQIETKESIEKALQDLGIGSNHIVIDLIRLKI